MKTLIKIIVYDGDVQAVYANTNDIEVELLDLDERDYEDKLGRIKQRIDDLDTNGDFQEIAMTKP